MEARQKQREDQKKLKEAQARAAQKGPMGKQVINYYYHVHQPFPFFQVLVVSRKVGKNDIASDIIVNITLCNILLNMTINLMRL